MYVLWWFCSGRLLRETVLGIACQMGDQDSLDHALSMFDQWIDGTIRLAFPGDHLNLFSVCSGFTSGNPPPAVFWPAAYQWTWDCWSIGTAWRGRAPRVSRTSRGSGWWCFRGTTKWLWLRRRTSCCTDWRRWRTWNSSTRNYNISFFHFFTSLSWNQHSADQPTTRGPSF